MERKYSQLSQENLSESDELTTSHSFEEDRSQIFFKHRQSRWIKLHITVLYGLIAALSISLGSIWFKRSPHRDLGALYSMSYLLKFLLRSAYDELSDENSPCEKGSRILSTQIYMEFLGQRGVYGLSNRQS
jgi:hypothetical protein